MATEVLSNLISTPVLVSFVVLLLIYYSMKYFVRDIGYNYPPGPRGIPFFGYSPNLGNKPYELLQEFSKTYGDIFTITIAFRRYVVLNSYESIRAAYINDGNNYLDRPKDYSVLGSLVDFKALALKNRDEWKAQRKILTSSLKSLSRDDSGTTMLERRISEAARLMSQEILKLGSNPADLYGIFASATINAVSSLVCSETLAATEPEIAKSILSNCREAYGLLPGGDGFLAGIIVKIISNRFTRKQKRIIEIREKQFNLMNRFIQEHQATFDANNLRDYIDLYLNEKLKFGESTKEGQWFSLENLRANMFMFYLAGIDTTSSAMYFAAFLMAKYPEVQERCRQEIDEAVGPDIPVCFLHRKRLPYIEAVINEVIRYSVIGPLPQPRCTTNPVTLQGFRFPAETDIITNLWSATRDGNYWTNATEFDPDNFYGRDIPRDLASLPFSAGKRICPAEDLVRMEIFLFFTTLLQKFKLSIPADTNFKEKIQPGFTRVLAPFNVVVTPC